jgi:hypothetical protein
MLPVCATQQPGQQCQPGVLPELIVPTATVVVAFVDRQYPSDWRIRVRRVFILLVFVASMGRPRG